MCKRRRWRGGASASCCGRASAAVSCCGRAVLGLRSSCLRLHWLLRPLTPSRSAAAELIVLAARSAAENCGSLPAVGAVCGGAMLAACRMALRRIVIGLAWRSSLTFAPLCGSAHSALHIAKLVCHHTVVCWHTTGSYLAAAAVGAQAGVWSSSTSGLFIFPSWGVGARAGVLRTGWTVGAGGFFWRWRRRPPLGS
jgi:hypothetical protein